MVDTMTMSEEMQYVQLVKRIISDGSKNNDRTGIGTRSLFGMQMRFSLRQSVIPLLTTKRVNFRAILEELLWFISGSTNAADLSARGVRIWDANASRETLNKLGFSERRVGDLGPIYGFQWRHFGAEYNTAQDDYTGMGIDQLKQVVETLRRDPYSRRIIMTAWNPVDLPKMALPPCHCMVQFYVNDKRELSCHLYQRSADMGIGVPFNIASYALLTRMIAHITNLEPGELIHTMGDCHIYNNHIEAIQRQLTREPRPFPKLRINISDAATIREIDDFRAEHFELMDYKPHEKIFLEMAI